MASYLKIMMPKKDVFTERTIAKICVVVICIAAAFFGGGCGVASSGPAQTPGSAYAEPKVLGTIRSAEIGESSGIAPSRCQSNVFWTHNDAGDDAYVYAINTAGDKLGTWRIPNAKNDDWEDIATSKDKLGKCFLYIGEIGNNELDRSERAVYRVAEPVVVPANAASSQKQPLATENAEMLRFTYPDKNNNAETLMVHPTTGDIYVLTKLVDGPSGVYRIKPEFAATNPQKAQMIARISVPAIPNGLLTGGDISPDGRRVIVCDYSRAYELVLPENAAGFDDIWKQTPQPVELGKRKNGESVAYSVDGTSIYATSERKDSPVIEVRRK